MPAPDRPGGLALWRPKRIDDEEDDLAAIERSRGDATAPAHGPALLRLSIERPRFASAFERPFATICTNDSSADEVAIGLAVAIVCYCALEVCDILSSHFADILSARISASVSSFVMRKISFTLIGIALVSAIAARQFLTCKNLCNEAFWKGSP
ncbi:MAG: hypothetical protein KJO78_12715, partial [Alphaproteobacteria bacterium]|nr:hypothetical protein [Alphaproteobacteria bacterium]